MFRSTIAAGLAALSIASFSPAAKADVDIGIFLGNTGYYDGFDDDCVYIGHRYRCSHGGVVAPFHHGLVVPHLRHPRHIERRISCSWARDLVEDQGFHRVKARDCEGKRYGFSARKNGKRYFVTVSAITGRISVQRV